MEEILPEKTVNSFSNTTPIQIYYFRPMTERVRVTESISQGEVWLFMCVGVPTPQITNFKIG